MVNYGFEILFCVDLPVPNYSIHYISKSPIRNLKNDSCVSARKYGNRKDRHSSTL